MNLIFFDDQSWDNLLPLTFTRPVANLRLGILTIREKWEHYLGNRGSFLSRAYLREKYPLSVSQDNILVNGAMLPDNHLVSEVKNLQSGHGIQKNNRLLAIRLPAGDVKSFSLSSAGQYTLKAFENELSIINYPWDIFSMNGPLLEQDFNIITKGSQSAEISSTNNLLAKENIFFEQGAKAEFVTLNATNGPIYIGKDAEIMEGSVIRGPFALGGHSVVKLNAKIYGPTTVGPHSKVGGEMNNSVILGYSNKAHDGFLGNSVIGEWCNLGADTNNSNLKNNYTGVKAWNYTKECFIRTGLQFCGLIMGDHSKSGINTMFNTGTVVGVNANVYGSGFPRNYIPSFSWGGAGGFKEYSLTKAFEVAEMVMKRRGIEFDAIEQNILRHIFETTKQYR